MKYTLALLPFVAGVAAAHPGHDHSAWTAPFLHAIWLAPIVAATIFAIYAIAKKINNKN